MNSIIRVGIVDDHPIFTIPFANLINRLTGFRATLVANSGQQTLDLLNEQTDKPDIILMDITMPVMDGIETTKHINTLYPHIKVVALSATYKEDTLLQIFAAGACAYLLKDIAPATLEEALHEVYQKGKYHADIYHLYERELQEYKRRDQQINLTRRELEVLQCMRNGLTIDETARTLFISPSMVKSQRAHLNEKFDTTSAIIVVLEALRRGILKW